jgi:hypothetical protein
VKYFIEKQRFTQWWLWLLNLGLLAIPIYGIVKQIIYKIPFGTKPMSNLGLIVFLIFMLLFNYFFLTLKLKTTINEVGIKYSFFPFQLKEKTIKWEDVKSIYTRLYNPITEYGGWGLKHGAVNVKGNVGIQLELKNGKKLLIGTQKKQEVETVLKTYKNKI